MDRQALTELSRTSMPELITAPEAGDARWRQVCQMMPGMPHMPDGARNVSDMPDGVDGA